MGSESSSSNISKGALWTGRVLCAVPGLFLVLDGVMKLVKPAPVLEATARLGYSQSVIVPIGVVLLVCTLFYFIPRTSVIGAILLTGYLGGAVATHVRAGSSTFETVFPAIFAIVLWIGLVLREPRLRFVLPWQT